MSLKTSSHVLGLDWQTFFPRPCKMASGKSEKKIYREFDVHDQNGNAGKGT